MEFRLKFLKFWVELYNSFAFLEDIRKPPTRVNPNRLLTIHYYITIVFVFKLFIPKGAVLNLQWCKHKILAKYRTKHIYYFYMFYYFVFATA